METIYLSYVSLTRSIMIHIQFMENYESDNGAVADAINSINNCAHCVQRFTRLIETSSSNVQQPT